MDQRIETFGGDWQQVRKYEDITCRKAGGKARIAFNRPEFGYRVGLWRS